jgi:outer membrane protein assembly factor BamB
VRWKLLVWPVAVVLAIAAAALARAWTGEAAQRQDRVVATILTTVLASAAVLLWTLLWVAALSRLRWRVRLGVFAVVAAAFALLRLSVELHGWTGDVVPVLRWRFARAAGELPAEPVGPSDVPQAAGAARPAGDWPQFQGPNRDGSLPGVQLARSWSPPPREVWRRPVGAGWSGFAVSGRFAVTQEQRGAEELVTCYDLETGQPRWTHAEPERFEDRIGGPGPRATPAIHEGRVYAIGATGILCALDLATGERIWSVNVVEDCGAPVPTYGVAASPLVVDGRVVVFAGGTDDCSLVAYDAAGGERVWSAGNGAAAYGSPVAAGIAGHEQILVLTDSKVVGHAREDGRVLWEHPWPADPEKTFQPLALPGDRVFVSQGYGVGGKLLRVDRREDGRLAAELVWESLALKAKFTNVVHHDGSLYGLDDGILVCLDPATGERRWKSGRYGHGQVILAGGLLLIGAENGDVALVEARPDGHVELGRFSAVRGKTWNHPALAGPYLLVRNDREAACFELPLG